MDGTIHESTFVSTVEFGMSGGRVRCEGEHLPMVLETAGVAGTILIRSRAVHRSRDESEASHNAAALARSVERLKQVFCTSLRCLVEIVPRNGCPLWFSNTGIG